MNQWPLELRKHRLVYGENACEYFVRQRKLRLHRKGRLPLAQASFVFAVKHSSKRSMLPSAVPVPLRLRCCGKLHRVSVRLCGAIKFHDHTRSELRALTTLRALGDNTCGCLDVPVRVRDSTTWRGEKDVFVRTIQHTKGLRSGLPLALRATTHVLLAKAPPTKDQRLARLRARIVDAAKRVYESSLSGRTYLSLSPVVVGVSDAKHAPGVSIRGEESFNSAGGWEPGKGSAVIVLPMTWLLRVQDRTHAVEGLFCFGFKQQDVDHGLAQVWVRTEASKF